MKLLTTYDKENNTIFQNFGNTKYFKVYGIENGQVQYSEIVGTMGKKENELMDILLFLETDVLICGNIGEHFVMDLINEGIILYSNYCGNTDIAVEQFLKGELLSDN